MDPLEVTQVCCDLISSVINLIQIWKNKDHYLDSVMTFLNSIGDTIQKCKNDKNFITSKQLAFKGLQEQLEDFFKYLEKEKKKNSIVRFFKGSDFIKECDSSIAELQKWMMALSLDLNLHQGEANARNFQDLLNNMIKMNEERSKSKCTFKDKFRNTTAAAFWIKYFEDMQDVEWKEFEMNFRAFVWKTEKVELSNPVLEMIAKVLDQDMNKVINFKEWDEFYETVWTRFDSKAQFLQACAGGVMTVTQTNWEKKKEDLPPLTLVYIETNTDVEDYKTKMKPFDFELNQEFLITSTGYSYEKPDGKTVENKKNLEKDALVVGRCIPKNKQDKDYIPPDIEFNQKISTISRKQFHITVKNTSKSKGYFITDLSSVNPTSFRVRDIPYALNKGMLIDLNMYLFEITEVFPMAAETENQEDYFFLPTDGKVSGDGIRETLRRLNLKSYHKDSEEEEEKKDYSDDDDEIPDKTEKIRKKKSEGGKKNTDTKPYVKLRLMNQFLPQDEHKERYISPKDISSKIECSEKVERDNENFTLLGEKTSKNAFFSVGRDMKNEIIVLDKDFDKFYCQFYYDKEKQGWFLVEKHPLSKQKNFSFGTLILLKNFKQYKGNKIGSIGYKLGNNMQLFSNWHVFKVKLPEN